ncbi:flagellar motor protein MotB [Massilia horti]|uniref:Histidine kinase n=1 Tax=Massilia horti TaxID=2562153 RepID=A0A4Y9SYI6_9BURK|nr:flagellar motor protein MotB [Massilia horti]TFW29693.1 histidine kinase [Massilia horti]
MSKLNEKHQETIVKRGGGRHGEDDHGGAWKVAFADFCLALMALFLVLWLMAARQQQALANIVKDATNGMLQGPGSKPEVAPSQKGSLIERFQLPVHGDGPGKGNGAGNGPGGSRAYETPADLAELSKALAAMSADQGLAANLDAVITPSGLRVMMHDTDKQGMFLRGSPLPTPRFARLLKQMGPLFAQMQNQMLIVGHTDSVQFSDTRTTAFSNWQLSTQRAMAARAELLGGGMRQESVLQVVGMADGAPLEPADTTASVNRRIELLILTRAQAASVAAMFGKPGAGKREVSTGTPEAPELQQLRSQLAN